MSGVWERFRAAFNSLLPRERMLVSTAGALIGIAAIYLGTVVPLLELGTGTRRNLDSMSQQLEAMKRLRAQYDDVDQRLAAVEERVRSGPRGNLRTTLETLAREALVKVESMEPVASPANDRYRETKVEVGLGAVTLAQTVGYLNQIEMARQLLSVKSLRIRTRSDKSDLLDVSFTVSSFEPL